MTSQVSSCTSDLSTITNDGSLHANITAKVVDSATPSKPVPNATVTWTVSGTGQGTVTPPSSTTDAQGVATTQLTAKANGMVTVKATTADDANGKDAHVLVSEGLKKPSVLNAEEDGVLDHYDIAFGVTAIIPSYGEITSNQTITFHWGEKYKKEFEVYDSSEFPYPIDVSDNFPPEALQDGKYQVYYSAQDQAGNQTNSSAVAITVKDGGQTVPVLAKPEVPKAEDGYINIVDALDGVTVNIDSKSFSTGDTVTLYWLAMDNNGLKLDDAKYTKDHKVGDNEPIINFDIPIVKLLLSDNQGYEGKVDCYYALTTADDTVKVSKTYHCNIDTVAP